MNIAKRIERLGRKSLSPKKKEPVYVVQCAGCGKEIRSDGDLLGVQYVKTGSEREFFFHEDCRKTVWEKKIR